MSSTQNDSRARRGASRANPGYLTTVTAVYASAAEARDAMAAMRAEEFVTVARRARTITAVQHWAGRSKYGPVRPAVRALDDLFDPVADDDVYRPWPVKLSIETKP